MKEQYKDEIIDGLKAVVYALIVALLITKILILNSSVPSGSMQNTIMIQDRLISNRLAYLFDEPKRYDIVVFKWPDDEKVLYVKRIIGLPGETVEIINGKVYINGNNVPLEDDFILETFTGNFGPYEVPEGRYFMLGDNRNNSIDSRYWHTRYVEKKKILGKVIFRYYPNFYKF